MDLICMQSLPLAEALDRVRNDQEHITIPLGATVDAIGAPKSTFIFSFLLRFVQLSQTLQCNSTRRSVLRS